MDKIIGKEKSVNDLLARKRYTIHYYQREYRWGKKQIEELLDDLVEEFKENYRENHIRKDGANYGHYYLGSVVITSDVAERAIIDGQQRLTSLTLLLIFLENLQNQRVSNEHVKIEDLIFSEEYGSKSFNISVEEREPCLNALYKGQSELFDPSGQPESVQTIYARYRDIKEIFPEDLKEDALPFFIEWLIKKVFLVEITAYTEQDAHKIFVSMNDRGLSLTPTEMLKGYLLSEIKDDTIRNKANDLWKQQILAIKSLEEESKEEDADFIKNWLRAQYAQTIRETKKGAEKEDFDLIGTEFHKWVRENSKKIALVKHEDYEDFILKEFKLFSNIYIRLKKYSERFHQEYEYVFYNANRNFTLQFQIILASITRDDSPETVNRKIKIVSCFIDQYITLRVFNFKVVDYSSIKNAVFNITKNIRQTSIADLVDKCKAELINTGFTLDGIEMFYLNQFTSRYMLHFLSRITYFIESGCGLNTKFEDYVNRSSKNPFDIEHIWSNHLNQHLDEFNLGEETEFQTYRNKFGALIILPRDKNRSFQANTYEQKLPMYFGENLLARSLDEKCYQNNPQFIKFLSEKNLPFMAHGEFKKKDISDRQQLYKEIAKNIWDMDLLHQL
jgi:uncharacterized protein with ParB-like and HNH nuclease domain